MIVEDRNEVRRGNGFLDPAIEILRKELYIMHAVTNLEKAPCLRVQQEDDGVKLW